MCDSPAHGGTPTASFCWGLCNPGGTPFGVGILKRWLKPSYLPRPPLGSRLEKAVHFAPHQVETQLDQLSCAPPMPSVIHSRTVPTNFWTFLGPPPAHLFMNVPKLQGTHQVFLRMLRLCLLPGVGQCFYGSVSIQLGRKILVCPPADNPSHCERASWDLMHVACGGRAGQEAHSILHFSFPSENLFLNFSWPLMEVTVSYQLQTLFVNIAY